MSALTVQTVADVNSGGGGGVIEGNESVTMTSRQRHFFFFLGPGCNRLTQSGAIE